jgi:ABC-type branched-subunit amino acid transport system substrate-binding protein
MKRRGGVVLALATIVVAALASTAGAGSSAVTATQAINCKSTVKLALITPLTGGGGFIGQEQLSWSKYAVKTLAKKYGLKVQLLQGDTPVEKGPGEALVVAQKFISDPKVLVAIGPATSGGVASASGALTAAGIAQISPSATRTSLTKGSNKEATNAFFRVVPGDYIQGPTDANYMVDKLNAKKVAIVDFQEPYSVGLADAAEVVLKKRNVSVTRLSTSVNTTDFSSLVTRVPSDAEVVFFPTQQPNDAQTFGQQLLEQGKRAKVFGGDGLEQPRPVQAVGLVRVQLRSGHQRHRVEQGADRRVEEGQSERDARLVRAAVVPRRRGRAERDQEGVRRGQGEDREPEARHPERQEDQPQDVDPRWARSASRRSRTTR